MGNQSTVHSTAALENAQMVSSLIESLNQMWKLFAVASNFEKSTKVSETIDYQSDEDFGQEIGLTISHKVALEERNDASSEHLFKKECLPKSSRS